VNRVRQPSGLSSTLAERMAKAMKTLRFGGKLDLLRRAQGLTFSQLFLKTGVPEKTLERICAGASAPCAAHFVRIVKALNIDMDAIEPSDLEELKP
jgi:transcriptional regulator with XRE-family HTH domain